MKRNYLKNLSFGLIAQVAVLGLATSCSEKITAPAETAPQTEVAKTTVATNQLKSATLVNNATTVPTIANLTLWAGQTINAGNLVVNEVDTNSDGIDDALAISYNLTGGWAFSEIHLWIGSDLSKLPKNNAGNPVPGNFPYKPLDAAGKTSYTINVPFSAIGYTTCSAQYYVAAHASVVKGTSSQTAWSAGTSINTKGQWATYSTIQVADVTAPSITGSVNDVEVEGCSAADVPLAVNNVAALEALGLCISDARTLKKDLIVTSTPDVVTAGCPIVVKRTYTVTDACGNGNSFTQTLKVKDTTAPVVAKLDPINVQCAGDVPAADISKVSATDNCGGTVTIAFVSDVTSGDACNTVITRTYSATDACGNVAKAEQTITVKDVTAPVLTGQGANATITAPETPVFTAPTATDNCDANPVITFVDITTPAANATSPTVVTRTWTATDAWGNASTTVSQTVTINPAPVPPTPPTVQPISLDATAWAYNADYSKTFTSYGDSKWGWTNGPISSPGTYTFTLRAGAGGNVGGTNVGTLTVVYDGSTATATYQLEAAYKMSDIQLYIGNTYYLYKRQGQSYVYTNVPGQFPNAVTYPAGVSSQTFTVNVSGSIYVMAHAHIL
ncbi:MAG: hypothetical protein LWW85_02615 [Marinilabiliales bacterium]|nr:hypothetical protein [Marinilabiliales bacterium]